MTFLSQGQAVDIALADQQRGLTSPCDWLEFAHLSMGTDGQVAGCWLFEGPRFGYGTHLPGKSFTLAKPPGGDWKGSSPSRLAPRAPLETPREWFRSVWHPPEAD